MLPPIADCGNAPAVFVAATIGANDGPQDNAITFLALTYVSEIRRVELEA